MKELLLLSGGVDSIALAYERRPAVALTVNYGQRAAAKEIEVSRYIARQLSISHFLVTFDLSVLGGGLLAGVEPMAEAPTPEWWPFRNQLLITLGAMAAVKEGLPAVVIGTVASDAAHADGTPGFLTRCRELLACQERSISLCAPASHISSVDLVRRSGIPTHLLASAHSCHRGNTACGRCRGCQKHLEIFDEIGVL